MLLDCLVVLVPYMTCSGISRLMGWFCCSGILFLVKGQNNAK